MAELALIRIHHELTAHDIWHYLLQERGYRRCQWGNDHHVLAAVETANNLYISSLRDTQAIAGDVIPRDEVQITFEQLAEKKHIIIEEARELCQYLSYVAKQPQSVVVPDQATLENNMLLCNLQTHCLMLT